MAHIREGIGVLIEGWFKDNLRRKVRDGIDTFFWTYRWLGGDVLNVRFRRLFELSVNKRVSVADIAQLGWGEGGGAWRWR